MRQDQDCRKYTGLNDIKWNDVLDDIINETLLADPDSAGTGMSGNDGFG